MAGRTVRKVLVSLAVAFGSVVTTGSFAAESARDPTAAITAFQIMYRWNNFNQIPGSVDQHSLVLPTGKDPLGSGKWQAGPAAVFIGKTPKIIWGVLAQSFFSFAGDKDRDSVRNLVVNPIFSYDLGNNWAIGGSDMSFSCDLKSSRWTNVPVGIRLEKLFSWGKNGTRVFVDVEHNVQDSRVSAGTTVRFFVVPLQCVSGADRAG